MNLDDQTFSTATSAVKNINLLKIDQNSLNVYPKCCQNHIHSAIPQIYASEAVTDCATISSQEKTFLVYYSDVENIRINGHENPGASMEMEMFQRSQSTSPPKRVSEDCKGNVTNQEPGKPIKYSYLFYKATPRGQHPGFILLSVKHEKINNAQPTVRGVTGGHKATALPQRKISRKRFRKVTSCLHNSDSIRALDFDPLATGDASTLGANTNERSPTSSRFRVTRIADSSSWWIPENSEMYICVHDLRTSSLPDFVTRQHHKVLASLSSCAANYVECGRDFWNCLEPDYLQRVNKGKVFN